MKRWETVVAVALLSAGGYWVYRSEMNAFNERQYHTIKRVFHIYARECREDESYEACQKLMDMISAGTEEKQEYWHKAVEEMIREECDTPEWVRNGEALDWLVETNWECFLGGDMRPKTGDGIPESGSNGVEVDADSVE